MYMTSFYFRVLTVESNMNMKKIFISILMIICGSLPVLAQQQEFSALSKILVNPIKDDTYTLNLYFDNEYRNKSFIQQSEPGLYYIYLPESTTKMRNASIIYGSNIDKKYIRLSVDKKPYINKDETSSYIRILVNMNADYSLKIISKTVNEDRLLLFLTSLKNSYHIFFFALAGILLLLCRKIISITRSTNRGNCYIPMPLNIDKNNETKLEKNALKNYVTEHANTNPFKTANRESFPSFDIPYKESEQKTNYNFQNTVQNKVQNPITSKKKEEEIVNNNLALPYADEVIKAKETKNTVEKKREDILSKINISNDKGLYLAAEENKMTLYGYVKDQTIRLTQFDDLSQINLQARFYYHGEEGDIYIVRLDSYKSMIAFSNDSIKELVVL